MALGGIIGGMIGGFAVFLTLLSYGDWEWSWEFFANEYTVAFFQLGMVPTAVVGVAIAYFIQVWSGRWK